MTGPVGSLEWRFAPEHMYAAVAALADRPAPGPTGEPTPEQWNALVRRVVDLVWSTGWMEGAAYAASLATPAPIVIPVEVVNRLVDAGGSVEQVTETLRRAFDPAQVDGEARTRAV